MEIVLLNFMPTNPGEWLIILAVVLLLFGGSRLPQLAKALGQSKRAFKEGMDDAEEDARREKARRVEAGDERPSLSAIDDEALFEEARRRARLRAAESGASEDNKLTSGKSTTNVPR